MRALVTDPEAPASIRLADVPEPEPGPDQVLVGVRHIGVNYGELAFAGRWPAGSVHGHDAAGFVERATADGSGPPVGTPVAVGLVEHAWAERVAVDVDALAVVPDGVDLRSAAGLAVAGVTALRALRTRSILGRRVLVTGASGGVGRFAVQLAALGGAHVLASVGSAARGAGLAELGAAEIVVGLEGLESVEDPVDLVLDPVGGPQLTAAWRLLAPGGDVQVIGWASGERVTFEPYDLFALGASKTISTFGDTAPVGADLAVLLDLIATGRLRTEIGWTGSWQRIAEAADALFARRVNGKIVLDVEVA